LAVSGNGASTSMGQGSYGRGKILATSILIVFLVATLVGGTHQAFGQNPTFSTPVNLSNTPTGIAVVPQDAASGNYVYVVWQDDVVGRPNVYFRASSNNGSSFAPTVLLSSNVGWAQNPQVAVSGSNVYVVWQDNSTGNFKIYLRASSNYGATFASSTNLGTTARVDDVNPQVAASANNVYVVWLENAKTPFENFRASSNHGNSFGSTVTLSGSSGTSFPPLIAVYGTNVYVAWRQNVATGNDDVFFDASNTNGTSFSPIMNLSNDPGESFDPSIAAYGNNVYVAWPDNTGLGPTNFDIFFVASSNAGATFSSVLNLSNNPGTSLNPQVAASRNSAYVVWQDNTPGRPQILFRPSTNNGTSFGATVNLSNDSGAAQTPRMTATGSEVYVVWDDTTTSSGADDIFFTSSSNNGAGFGSVLNISNNSGFSTAPQVAAYGSHVYVVWLDDTPSPGFNQAFFSAGSPTVIIAPVANPLSVLVGENQSVIIILTGHDSSGLPLTFSIVSGPAHATLSAVISTGPSSATVTYWPNPNFTGSDSFSFKVNNGSIDSAPATVSMTVLRNGGGGGAMHRMTL
jgi:hypothetical protein